jgi:predicted GH43/DUF377 family glycosyl hydrolase
MLHNRVFFRAALLMCCLATPGIPRRSSATTDRLACTSQGWQPTKFYLKDHSIFLHKGIYYLISIRFTQWGVEREFAYARSTDLCNWEDLGPLFGPGERQAGIWDSQGIWSPFVLAEQGVYYLYYTGVAEGITQSIMLATTTDPADPQAWQPQGMIFQPEHANMIWPGWGMWSDARDPMIIKLQSRYYLYYTGLDTRGGIVGVATAASLRGPWQDLGATLTIPGTIPESPTVATYGGRYYLFYNGTDGVGPEVRVSASPLGPWSAPHPISPGFAHEVWTNRDGKWMTSYVIDYAIGIKPIYWAAVASLPVPVILAEASPVFLPMVVTGRNQ